MDHANNFHSMPHLKKGTSGTLPIITAVWAAILATVWAASASAQILSDGQDRREIAFRVIDGKPFVPVQIGGAPGWMMVDNGTPEVVFLNRAALDLGPAPEVGRGFAASGQEVVVWLHDAPPFFVDGQPLVLPPKVSSGDFSFTKPAFGRDFMGFIGTPALESAVFHLDYGRGVLTVLRAGTAPDPQAEDILGHADFAVWPGGQPTMAGLVGDQPMLVDIDTGDGGTIYLAPQTKRALLAAGHLRQDAGRLVLAKLVLGGVTFRDLPLAAVLAGGPNDMRPTGTVDFLRLGSDFLAAYPVLWDFPAGRLVFLRPGASYPPARN